MECNSKYGELLAEEEEGTFIWVDGYDTKVWCSDRCSGVYCLEPCGIGVGVGIVCQIFGIGNSPSSCISVSVYS